MSKTSIEWTDRTWNPVRGCALVSPGCTNCYAMKQAHRFSGAGKPYDGLTRLTRRGPVWTGSARFIQSALYEPLRWKKPSRVFVNSMSDVFHESLDNEEIAAVFGVMAACPQHTFQVLTKRAERMREWFEWASTRTSPIVTGFVHASHVVGEAACNRDDSGRHMVELHENTAWPLPNVWLGVSVEDQQRADERIPDLLMTPAAVRFVSAEPLLGSVKFKSNWLGREDWNDFIGPCPHGRDPWPRCDWCSENCLRWVIVGGESGPGARPFDLAWARAIVHQCTAAGVACFVKQIGSAPLSSESADVGDHAAAGLYPFRDRKGGDPSEWPEDLRVRQWPEARP